MTTVWGAEQVKLIEPRKAGRVLTMGLMKNAKRVVSQMCLANGMLKMRLVTLLWKVRRQKVVWRTRLLKVRVPTAHFRKVYFPQARPSEMIGVLQVSVMVWGT
jgi:hypothetical protein